MGEAIRKKHAQTYRSSQEIQHVIPVTVMFLSYIDIYRQNNRFINAFESIRDFHLICTSGAGQCLLSSSFSPVYPKQQGRCRAVAMSMLFLFCFDSDKSFQTDKYHFCWTKYFPSSSLVEHLKWARYHCCCQALLSLISLLTVTQTQLYRRSCKVSMYIQTHTDRYCSQTQAWR